MTEHGKSWVLVTGASSGFGIEFAKQYAAQGRSLIIVARTLSKLESLATELRERFDVEVMVEAVDLSSIAAVTDLHQRLRDRNMVVDVLINNAGHGLQGPFLDEPLEHSLAMIDLDIASLTAMTRLFGEDMRARRKGSILMVASLLAYQGVKSFAVYSAAKAYALRFFDALHRELKGEGVVVTGPVPGHVGYRICRSSQATSYAGIEDDHDAARAGCSCRDPGATGGPHECGARIRQQGNDGSDLGDTALVASIYSCRSSWEIEWRSL